MITFEGEEFMFWTTDGESINCLMMIYGWNIVSHLSLVISQNKLFCHIHLKYFMLMISIHDIE